MSKIDRIFISHLHGDHYYGLMGLISSMHLYGRESTLHIHGPFGLSEIITLQLKYGGNTLNFEIDFHIWEPDLVQVAYEDDYMTVTTLPMNHRIPCMGFIFREKPKKRRINKDLLKGAIPPVHINSLIKGKDVLDERGNVKYSWEKYTLPPRPSYSYAYCADTKYHPGLVPHLQGVDLLYHEATFTDDWHDRAQATFHSTAREAALIAKAAQVGKLIIGHFSNRYKDLTPLLTEARNEFSKVALAIEGETFTIDY